MSAGIAIPQDQIAEFCRRNHIIWLALFGSALRDDFGPDSDVDVLIEFEPGEGTGFFGLVRMQEELSEMIGGRQVDLVTVDSLYHRIRDSVLAEAQVLYVQEG